MPNSLTFGDKRFIKQEFYNQGYVLDFSDTTFAEFTYDCVGISVKDKYGGSKGSALMTFFDDADDHQCAKLLNALVAYKKELSVLNGQSIDQKESKLLEECQEIADRLQSSDALKFHEDILRESAFNSDHIEKQIAQMYGSIDNNPTDAIGKAKELLESCAKTILNNRKVEYDNKCDFNTLMNKVFGTLNLKRDSVPDDRKASETIKNILSCASTIVNGVNNLRNSYGTGHGKENDFKGLSRRHARLVVGLSGAITMFLWDTHEAMPKN